MANTPAVVARFLRLLKNVPPAELQKAVEDLGDTVDIDVADVAARAYNGNLRETLDHVPTGAENPTGREVAASGTGSKAFADAYSALATNQNQMMQAYAAMADMLEGERAARKSLESAFVTFAGAVAGKHGWRDLQKAIADYEAESAKANQATWPTSRKPVEGKEKDEQAEGDMEAAEKAAAEGNPAVKSIAEVFSAAFGAADRTLNPPPDLSAFAKSVRHDGPSDEEIARMSCEDATEALMQRQRAIHRARVAAGQMVPPPLRMV